MARFLVAARMLMRGGAVSIEGGRGIEVSCIRTRCVRDAHYERALAKERSRVAWHRVDDGDEDVVLLHPPSNLHTNDVVGDDVVG
ncbi:hypothetical protein C8R45DRAFT_1011503 [Mycena sanguinolenta]|nr:hypothetical protein C8R45DRAFT_1011503 [Mycena sanguinolenta]